MRVLSLACMAFVACCAEKRVPIGFRDSGPDWKKGTLQAKQSEPITFTVYLKQTGLDRLNEIFVEVSDPKSPKYGMYLTQQQLDDIVKAEVASFDAVLDWLAPWNSTSVVERSADTIKVRTTAQSAQEMFQVPFYPFHQKTSQRVRTLASGKPSIPVSLVDHIDFVGGLTEAWHGKSPTMKADMAKQRVNDQDLEVTPDLLRLYYGIPDDEKNPSSKNLQGIAAFNDYFSEDALSQFSNYYGLPLPDVSVMGVDCLGDQKPCDQVESDLDMQYITAIGKGVPTVFHNQNDNWVLQFSEDAQKLDPMPLVFSVSYGWAELKQCDIAFMPCTTLGYDSAQYVDRTNTNFQKLATMGVTILVSDGDDGAQGAEPSGDNPVDLDRWCGASEYACYPETTSKCAEVNLRNHSIPGNPYCPWPAGYNGDPCNWLYLGDFYQTEDIIKALQDANPTCNMQVFYDSSYGVHLYSECECEDLAPVSHEGVTSEPFKYNSSARLFFADFPTDSPYVTSVGATLFKSATGSDVDAEHAASIVDGGIITTGGGFSALTDQPDWQKQAVKAWVANAPDEVKPPSNTYDATKRGYPDVTLNGHNYQVFYADDGKENCNPCKRGGVDGTSASSPAFAGMVSLMNGYLLDAGKPPLGFLNPLLYQMAEEEPAAFNDITFGDNKCTRNFCMIYGYNATKGWDPVAGLGSVNYAEMKNYVMSK